MGGRLIRRSKLLEQLGELLAELAEPGVDLAVNPVHLGFDRGHAALQGGQARGHGVHDLRGRRSGDIGRIRALGRRGSVENRLQGAVRPQQGGVGVLEPLHEGNEFSHLADHVAVDHGLDGRIDVRDGLRACRLRVERGRGGDGRGSRSGCGRGRGRGDGRRAGGVGSAFLRLSRQAKMPIRTRDDNGQADVAGRMGVSPFLVEVFMGGGTLASQGSTSSGSEIFASPRRSTSCR